MSAPSHKKLVSILLGIVLLMSGFAFALVPLYDVFCELTGLNGKVDYQNPVEPMPSPSALENTERSVVLEFVSQKATGLAASFTPQESQLSVQLGRSYVTAFVAQNLSDQPLSVQAVPSVSPGMAGRYLQKVVCFCFTQQTLAPFEKKEMSLQFTIAPELPDEIKRLSLAYTFYPL